MVNRKNFLVITLIQQLIFDWSDTKDTYLSTNNLGV